MISLLIKEEFQSIFPSYYNDHLFDDISQYYDTLPGSKKFGFHHHFGEQFKKQKIIELNFCIIRNEYSNKYFAWKKLSI